MALVAEIIAVGTELLLGHTANTDAQTISQGLSELGVTVYFHTVVGDNAARLAQAVGAACERSDILIFTGGLGPTYDDITKQVVAGFFQKSLTRHEPSLRRIEAYFQRTGATPAAGHERQAWLPEGCLVLDNDWGTAPGCIFQANGKHIILLPGPPRECTALFRTRAMPYLQSLSDGCLVSRMIGIFGIGESAVEELLAERMENAVNPTIAPYAKEGEVTLRVTARANTPEEAAALADPVVDELRHVLGDVVYGVDVHSLENAVSGLLRARGLTLAAAESCTGGLIGARMTALPGASDVYAGGICAYTPQTKQSLLGVDPALIERHGIVSEAVAEAMACGVRSRTGADLAVGVTGYAGPAGGDGVPVGTVCIALCGQSGLVASRRFLLGSERSRVRTLAANHALELVRRHFISS